VATGSSGPIHATGADLLIETATAELDKVLKSQTFGKAPTLRRLLEYLWQHRDEEISEYAIATEALKRRADFEPRYDATVRVLVSRLRRRLKDYYEGEGSELATRIDIPLGTHQIQMIEKGSAEEQAPFPLAAHKGGLSKKLEISKKIIVVQLLLILLLATGGWQLWAKLRRLSLATQSRPATMQPFWSQFLNNGKNTRIIVPNPIFFAYANGLMVRDVQVNDFQALIDSKRLRKLRDEYGSPSLSQQYVASSDAFAMARLDQFLETHGKLVSISPTGETSIDVIEHENVIVAGTSHTLESLPGILSRLSFQVDTMNSRVYNHKPLPGELAVIDTVHETPSRVVTPGVIASLPGGPAGTHLLVLVTTYNTSALVAFLISESGVRALQQAQAGHGNCQYFEAVIESRIDGNTELGSKLTIFHPYHP